MTPQQVIGKIGKPGLAYTDSQQELHYVYKNDPKKFMNVGFRNGKAVTIYVYGPGISIAGIAPKMTTSQAKVAIQKNKAKYRINEVSYVNTGIDARVVVNGATKLVLGGQINEKVNNLMNVSIFDYTNDIKNRLISPDPMYNTFNRYNNLNFNVRSTIDKGQAKYVFELINMERKNRGLQPLQWDTKMSENNQLYAAEMAKFFPYVPAYKANMTARDLVEGLPGTKSYEQISKERNYTPKIKGKWFTRYALTPGLFYNESLKNNFDVLSRKDITHVGVGLVRDCYVVTYY